MKHEKLGDPMDASREDVIACMDFPMAHWPQIASTNPLGGLNREIRRRSGVVGICPNAPAAIRPVGGLMLEASDEWAVARRCMSLETPAGIDDTAPIGLPTAVT